MANYSFSTITAAQALAFNAATDTISLLTTTSSTVSFDDAHHQVTIAASGNTIVFGAGVYGANIAATVGGEMVIGSPQDDYLVGGRQDDAIFAGAGNDTIAGGTGADHLSGGPGADLFVLPQGNTPSDSLFLATFSPEITDWETRDSLYFGVVPGSAANYREATAASFSEAEVLAKQLISSGAATYVAVAVGGEVMVFSDSLGDKGSAVSDVFLHGRTLADIDFTNIVGGAAPTLTGVGNEPVLPTPLLPASGGASGFIIGDIDSAHLGHLQGAAVTAALPGGFELTGAGGDLLHLGGFGFTYDQHQQLTGGQLFSVTFIDNLTGGPTPANLADPSLGVFQADLTVPIGSSVAPFVGAVQGDTTQQTFSAILNGNDQLNGSTGADLIRGYDGDDILGGGGGNDTIFGGAGSDIIRAGVGAGVPVGQTYLRGEDGADYIIGGDGFDDINGNMGNDTLSGGNGGDWVVGGKDNDLQFGDAGDDIVWGNLGNDTLVGGDGADQVRGGQGDDVLFGGAGNDFVSGDRGNDTITGGAGADLFHGSQDAGIDRVTDFHLSEGDRVMLDPGTTFTLRQDGADTVIDMGGGNQMILVGVQLSTLTGNWIFEG
jgi:Ca2+-binding RTX toxin-like protein